MDRTEKVELTTLCLVYNQNKILLQNRVKKDWKGYALPGGHVERGESIVSSVIREIKEETGLTIKHPKLCGVKQFPIDGGRYIVFLFETDEYEGELISSEEGKMEWIDRNKLSQLNTVNDLEELLMVMEEERFTEFTYVARGDKWDVEIR